MNIAAKDPEFGEIDISKAVMLKNVRHIAYCMVWAPCEPDDFTRSESDALSYFVNHNSAAIRMHIRFDGKLGFPGCLVPEEFEELDPSDRIELMIMALNKELKEQVNLSNGRHTVYGSNHLFTHKVPTGNFILHFFNLQMNHDEFRRVELKAMESQDFGEEYFGICRVPTYTMENGYDGFPAFLQNSFYKNSKQQLLKAIEVLKIMEKEEIKSALNAYKPKANK